MVICTFAWLAMHGCKCTVNFSIWALKTETRGVHALCSWELFSLYTARYMYNHGYIGDTVRLSPPSGVKIIRDMRSHNLNY